MLNELTEPVDLAIGNRLNPAAVGWSRTPLHRCQLPRNGRTKRWQYWCIMSGPWLVAVTVVDVDVAGAVIVEARNLADGSTVSHAMPMAPRRLALPDGAAGTIEHQVGSGTVRIADGTDGTHIAVSMGRGDARVQLDVLVELPEGHESLNVVVPWNDRQFQYTSKHVARPASGTLTWGSTSVELGGSDEAWGFLDVGRGRWPHRVRWNWGAAAGYSDSGSTVGAQMGGRWTQGTGSTENAVSVDGTIWPIQRELTWAYPDGGDGPWTVSGEHHGVGLDLEMQTFQIRRSRLNLGLVASTGFASYGRWSGRIWTPEGSHELNDAVGFAEDMAWVW